MCACMPASRFPNCIDLRGFHESPCLKHGNPVFAGHHSQEQVMNGEYLKVLWRAGQTSEGLQGWGSLHTSDGGGPSIERFTMNWGGDGDLP